MAITAVSTESASPPMTTGSIAAMMTIVAPLWRPDRRGETRAIVIFSPLASHSRFMVAEAVTFAVLR